MKALKEMVGDVIEQRLNPRFDAIDARFDAVDARFEAIDARFDGIDGRLDAIDGRLDHIEEDVAVIKDMVKDHGFEIARLKHKTA